MAPLIIPLPPTANKIWRTVGNRTYATKEYRDWLKLCADLFREHWRPIDGPVRVTLTIRYGKGFPCSRDADNCLKPVMDALKPPRHAKDGTLTGDGASIIPDDCIEVVRGIAIEVLPAHDKKSEAECWVMVESIECPPLLPASTKRPTKPHGAGLF